jgi:hypothetical protein
MKKLKPLVVCILISTLLSACLKDEEKENEKE